MAWYDFKRKSTEVIKEPVIKIKTGTTEARFWYGGYVGRIDKTLDVPLKEAVQYLIDHLGIQIKYEPAKEECRGPMFVPKKEKDDE